MVLGSSLQFQSVTSCYEKTKLQKILVLDYLTQEEWKLLCGNRIIIYAMRCYKGDSLRYI